MRIQNVDCRDRTLGPTSCISLTPVWGMTSLFSSFPERPGLPAQLRDWLQSLSTRKPGTSQLHSQALVGQKACVGCRPEATTLDSAAGYSAIP